MISLNFELSLGIPILQGGFQHALVQKQAVAEVMKYNDLSAKYGLVLSEQQAIALVETRSTSLRETGRIEFGGGVIDKLIEQFCDSPYLTSQNYEETLHELVKTFYYYKNETLDRMPDDDLIQFMKSAFDGVCEGSVDKLAEMELEQLARNLRKGLPPNAPTDPAPLWLNEEDDYDEY